MPIDNPTFSQTWYRVAALAVNLRPAVQMRRQFFRGQPWHVLYEPMSNRFARLHEAGYRFVGLFNGRRTVEEIWRICQGQLGEDALTQGEVIQLLGDLYQSELIQSDSAPDIDSLFRRRQQRIRRKVQGVLSNLTFFRIPLFDPDALLDRWLWLFGRAFTAPGLILWAAMVLAGAYAAFSRADQWLAQTDSALAGDKLWLLYASLAALSLLHEFSHAFACKWFARDTNQGQVHTMGLALLVLLPLPYVDVSSAWSLRGKWPRIAVNAAGMMADLAVAAVAALTWAATPDGTTLHLIAYNLTFIAGVSTLLFNGNPLLRYDGYYILADLLEIPNLAQQSNQFLQHLVKKYLWGARDSLAPSEQPGELAWMAVYGVAALAYRIVVCLSVIWFISMRFFFVGVALALAAAVAWVVVPLIRLIHYLVGSDQIARTRPRACLSTAILAAAAIALVGAVRLPDRHSLEGVVEPLGLQEVHAASEGFVVRCMESGAKVSAGDGPLVLARNDELASKLQESLARLRGLESQKAQAVAESRPPDAQAIDDKIQATQDEIRQAEHRLAGLTTTAPIDGYWISPQASSKEGSFLHEGDKVGIVATLDQWIIRATAPQDTAALLVHQAGRGALQADGNSQADAHLQADGNPQADRNVQIRLMGRPDVIFAGQIRDVFPAGSRQLPSPSLGHTAGGGIVTDIDERGRTKAKEDLFEVRIIPDLPPSALFAGQRVLIRFRTPDQPLLQQALRKLLQAFHKRFGA